jgi:CDP-diacylglycerol--inositol 3-phosphatidyltransferase
MVLASLYPDLFFLFLAAVGVDIMSHFAHLYSSLLRGVGSHKAISDNQSALLRVYYTNKLVLGALCALNEGFFLFLYTHHYWKESQPMIPVGSTVANYMAETFPWSRADTTENTLPLLIVLIITFVGPGMVIKNLINLVQLQQASKDIVEIDEEERAVMLATPRPRGRSPRSRSPASKKRA